MLTLAIFAVAAAAALIETSARAYGSRAAWRREARISVVLGAAALLIDVLMPDHAGGNAAFARRGGASAELRRASNQCLF